MRIFLLSVGMMVVTYLPRLLPLVALRNIRLPRRLSAFLSFVPVAAIGALIIPGGFSSVDGSWLASSIGLLAALVSAWYFRSIIVTVVLSILSVYLFFQIV
jgi:branched-subunit amino acid transport protein